MLLNGFPKIRPLKLSEKGNEQRSDPVFSCIRSATRTEKYGFGLPHGYAVSASEAFRTVSEGMFWEVQSKSKKYMIAVTVAAPAITHSSLQRVLSSWPSSSGSGLQPPRRRSRTSPAA